MSVTLMINSFLFLQARAELLDRLVCDGFSDSGDSDSDTCADGNIGDAFVRNFKLKKTGEYTHLPVHEYDSLS